MKRFRFKLDKLLKLRGFRERRAELVFAEKAGACALLETKLADNMERRARTTRERFAPGREIADFRASEMYILRLDRERDRLARDLAAAELEREAARAAYLGFRREREAVDKLRERRESEYYRLALREETKVLDDMARRPLAEAKG
jgi:flagellar export protein FliJ